MTGRERVEAVYALRPADRVPFVPAIYEHKARLIGVSPSALCRDAELLVAGMERELEAYDPDMLVAGVDVYNVEAEALGCRVRYFDDSNHVPAIVEPLLSQPSGLDRLGLPDPASAGRMPLYLEAAGTMAGRCAGERIVRGALTGPYSLAAELMGAEQFVVATVEEPAFARRLLEFTARVCVEFGRAFIERGAEPIIFDSRATPRLASPRVFREMVAPLYRDVVVPELTRAGARYVTVIIGGDTGSVVDGLVAARPAQLLCDAGCSLALFRERCLGRVAFRANVDARLVHSGPPEAVYGRAMEILEECGRHPGFLLGCGVVAYDTEPENVLAIRRAIEVYAAAVA